jgi:hypothetical protein
MQKITSFLTFNTDWLTNLTWTNRQPCGKTAFHSNIREAT